MTLEKSINKERVLDLIRLGFDKCRVGNKQGCVDCLEDAIVVYERHFDDLEIELNKISQNYGDKKLEKFKNQKNRPEDVKRYFYAIENINDLKKQVATIKSLRKFIKDHKIEDYLLARGGRNEREKHKSNVVESNKIQMKEYIQTLLKDLNLEGKELDHIGAKTVLKGLFASEYFENGKKEFSWGFYNRAERFFKKAVEKCNRLCDAYFALADCYLAQESYYNLMLQHKLAADCRKKAAESLNFVIKFFPFLTPESGEAITGRPLNTNSDFAYTPEGDSTIQRQIHAAKKKEIFGMTISEYVEIAKLRLAYVFFSSNSLDYARNFYKSLFLDQVHFPEYAQDEDFVLAFVSFATSKDKKNLLKTFKDKLFVENSYMLDQLAKKFGQF